MNATFSYNQAAEAVLMIRPKHFGFNPQTAETNIFQVKAGTNEVSLNETAVAEFDNFVSLLHKYDVDVIVIEDQDEHKTPDSVFPNNWFTTHHNGMMVYYVMYAPVRNLEVRSDFTDILTKRNFKIKGVLDLYDEEDERPGQFLEGTGSFVFDHINKVAYANLSSRTHPELAGKTSEFLGYELFSFVSLVDNREVYHTNVMLTVSENFAVICLDCLADDKKKKMLKDKLKSTGHELVIITIEQMKKFAGNMLSVKNKKGELITVMSQTAFDSLDESQLEIILRYSKILPVAVPVIETIGGGSVRCMMAEIFLPKAGTI